MNCQTAQERITVALLMHIELDDEVSRHVELCPSCAAEQASMRQVVAVMATVGSTDLHRTPIAPANDVHLQRILRAATAERARERRLTLLRRGLATGVAAVLVVVVSVWTVNQMRSDDVITAQASANGLEASTRITPIDEGSSVRVSVTGMPPDSECVVFVVTHDGRTDEVMRWTAEYEGTAFMTGNTPVPADEISQVLLKQPDGDLLLEIPVTD